jgi:hypothetical protein
MRPRAEPWPWCSEELRGEEGVREGRHHGRRRLQPHRNRASAVLGTSTQEAPRPRGSHPSRPPGAPPVSARITRSQASTGVSARSSEHQGRQRRAAEKEVGALPATVCRPTRNDPRALRTFKSTLADNIERCLTCLRVPGIPADNKRRSEPSGRSCSNARNSFGSKSARGAHTLATLWSALTTIAARSPRTSSLHTPLPEGNSTNPVSIYPVPS